MSSELEAERTAARKHVDDIRSWYLRLTDPDDMVYYTLKGLIRKLSSKVHYKHNHFLNELIQNFDDTAYASDQEPTVEFKLGESYLEAWSNEKGFTPEDVKSICSAGNSAKEGDPNSTGENGLGFKSVFIVADKVTILSYPYSFKFDTPADSGDIGMLIPTWVEHDTRPKAGTKITFRLRQSQVNWPRIFRQLESFDFRLLLFSRNLRLIKINILGTGSPSMTTATLHAGDNKQTHLIVTKTDGTIHSETSVSWRSHVKLETSISGRYNPTEIRLAFPTTPHRISQQNYPTYAFQPIQNFGFSFMLHADFILDASRSHVVLDQQWNLDLDPCIVNSIVGAFTWLATDAQSPLLVTWPLFLTCLGQVHDAYFSRIAKKARSKLFGIDLVRTEEQDTNGVNRPMYCSPEIAILVGVDFRDESGAPLLNHATDLRTVVSRAYSEAALSGLRSLGVAEMTFSSFIQRFTNMVYQHPTFFRAQSETWHSAVANVLLRHPRARSSLQVLMGCPIIPLEDGTWTEVTRGNTFLPSEIGPPIPTGFSINTVAVSAVQDPSRRALFQVLGLRQCDLSDVHRAILEDQFSQRWEKVHLLEQAVYLYLTGYNPEPHQLLVCSDSRGNAKSNTLVFFSKEKTASIRAFFDGDEDIAWLHEDYRHPPTIQDHLRQDWEAWLYKWNNIKSNVPVVGARGQLSPPFIRLYYCYGSAKALHVLRQIPNLPVSNPTWRTSVGDLVVETSHGPRMLKETTLPRLETEAGGMLPLINLEDPGTDWSFLGYFGVCISANSDFRFRQLGFLKSKSPGADVHASAEAVYLGLQSLVMDPLEIPLIKNAFDVLELILAEDSKWYTARDVRWDSQFPCTLLCLLRDKYKACRRFFRDALKVKTTNLADLIAEIRHQSLLISASSSSRADVGIIRNLLRSLDNMLKAGPKLGKLKTELRSLKMFPISIPGGQIELQSADSGEFWIPDIAVCHGRFWNRAPLLDMTGHHDGVNIENIVAALDLESQLLTKAEKNEFDGDLEAGTEDLALGKQLRRKSKYIKGILEAEAHPGNVGEKIHRLENLRVLRLAQIPVRRYVLGKTRIFEGEKATDDVRCVIEEDRFVLLVLESITQQRMARSLREEMAKYLEVTRHINLIGDVLAFDDPEELKEALQRAGAYRKDSKSFEPRLDIEAPEENDGDSDTLENENFSNAESMFTAPTDSRRQREATAEVAYQRQNWDENRQPSVNNGSTNRHPMNPPLRTPGDVGDEQRSSESNERVRIPQLHSPQRYPRPVSNKSSGQSFANNAGDEMLASSFSKVSLADAEHDSQANRELERLTTEPQTADNVMSTLQAPSRVIGRNEQISPPINQSTSGTLVSRPAPWFGRHLHAGGPSRSLHRRSWDGGSNPIGPTLANRAKEIGAKGEYLLYQFLRERLGHSFGLHNWTSNGRQRYYPEQESINEEDYADFTIEDPPTSQTFTQYLRTAWRWAKSVDSNTTYHLEVKSTTSTVDDMEAYWTISPNQVRMARQWSASLATPSVPLRDVYVLVRVFDVDGNEPKSWFVVDPWAADSIVVVSPVEMVLATPLNSISLQLLPGRVQDLADDDDLPACQRDNEPRSTAFPWDTPGWGGISDLRLDPRKFTFSPFQLSNRGEPASQKLPRFAGVPITLWTRLEPVLIEESLSSIPTNFHSITAMSAFKSWSFEELRLADLQTLGYDASSAAAPVESHHTTIFTKKRP